MKDNILLGHGSGGKLAHELVENSFLKPLYNGLLARMDDAAVFELGGSINLEITGGKELFVESIEVN